MRLPHEWYDLDVPEDVVLEERSYLYSSYAFLHSRSEVVPSVRLQADSGVYDGTIFELGPAGSVDVGRFSSVVAAVIRLDGQLIIEDHALVSWDVVITDLADEAVAPAGTLPSTTVTHEPMRIGSGAWIGARAILLRGASVGRDAIVGAGAVVREPVPPGAVVAGNPARVVSQQPGRMRSD